MTYTRVPLALMTCLFATEAISQNVRSANEICKIHLLDKVRGVHDYSCNTGESLMGLTTACFEPDFVEPCNKLMIENKIKDDEFRVQQQILAEQIRQSDIKRLHALGY